MRLAHSAGRGPCVDDCLCDAFKVADTCSCGHGEHDHGEFGKRGCWYHGTEGHECDALRPKDSLPRGGAEGVHVHEWGEWEPYLEDLRRAPWDLPHLERATCGCGRSKVRKLEKPRELCGSCDAGLPMSCTCPQEPGCTHCQGPHALEDCKGLEEPQEERCCSCGSSDVVYRNYREQDFCRHCADCTCGHVPCERKPADMPRRPPYAVAYAVEGGAQYEVAVSGDATVVAEDGALHILHPKKPVLAIVRIQPMDMEES